MDAGAIAGERLRSFVERAERLREERRALAEDLSELFKEAKGVGFDVPTIKRILAYRAKEQDVAEEQDMLFDTYMRALGHRPEVGTSRADIGTRAPAPARPAAE